MTTQSLLATQQERVLTLRLNRPEKKNALDAALYTSLSDALEAAAENPEVRVVVLAGSAELFSSGNDLQDFMAFAGDMHSLRVSCARSRPFPNRWWRLSMARPSASAPRCSCTAIWSTPARIRV